VSVFVDGRTNGNASYTFSGDLNGDGGTSNDLIYIPRNTSEMNFQQYTTAAGVTFTQAQQTAAWEAYIEQDPYLSAHRGQYAARNALFLPMVWRTDLSVAQDIFHKLSGHRPSFSVRLNILNFGNLLNHNWGVAQRLVTSQPLLAGSPVVDPLGQAQYRLANLSGQLITSTFQQTSSLDDVYKLMIGFGFTWN
jgi:hypothetical protein